MSRQDERKSDISNFTGKNSIPLITEKKLSPTRTRTPEFKRRRQPCHLKAKSERVWKL